MVPVSSAVTDSSRLPEGPLLAPGESVRVTVLSAQEDGRLLVLVKGAPLTAASEVGPLSAGQVIRAEVQVLDGQLVLRLEPPAGGPSAAADPSADPLPDLLRLLLPADDAIGAGVERLLGALRAATREAPGAADGPGAAQLTAELTALSERMALPSGRLSAEQVRAALNALGLQHEHELASRLLEAGSLAGDPGEPSLKAWLLTALDQLVPEGGEPVPAWGAELERLTTSVERAQVLTVLNAQEKQPLIFELALNWDGASTVRFAVEEREAEGRSGDGPARRFSLATLLELDGLGAVRVNAVLAGKRIGARLLVERPDVERALAGLLPRLQEGLTAQGFEVEGLSAGVADRTTLRGEDLRAKALPDLALVSVRA